MKVLSKVINGERMYSIGKLNNYNVFYSERLDSYFFSTGEEISTQAQSLIEWSDEDESDEDED